MNDEVQPLLERVDDVGQFLSSKVDSVLEQALIRGQSIGRPLMDDEQLATLERNVTVPASGALGVGEASKGKYQVQTSVVGNVSP